MTPPLRDAIATLGLSPAPAPPGASRFEALVAFTSGDLGTGSRRSTASALDASGFLDPEALATAAIEEIIDAASSSRVKILLKAARQLQRLARWYLDHRDDLEFEPAPGEDRPPFPLDELSAINGVGRSTADGIALHVFGFPSYPVDRASYRIMVRHGWIDTTVDYDEASQAVIAAAQGDPSVLAGLSDAFEGIGRRYCKASGPRCEPCPLKAVLPEGGPIEVDG